jgi:hypothetical protein
MASPDVSASKLALFSVRRKQEAIREEIAKLQMKLDVLDPEYDAAAEEHSRNLCLDFAQAMAKRLPRELRDMVYGYLLENDKYHTIVCINPTFKQALPEYHVHGNDLCNTQRPKSNQVPHYLRAEFIGADIGIEIGQAFYTRSDFALKNVEDLHPLLMDGPLRTLDLIRPMEFIQHLSVDVSFEPYGSTSRSRAVPQLDTKATKTDFQQKVVHLANIANVKHVSRLKLKILVQVCSIESATKFGQVLYPLVYDLKDKGAMIKVRYQSYPYHISDTSFESFDCDFNRPRSEWEQKVLSDSAFVST